MPSLRKRLIYGALGGSIGFASQMLVLYVPWYRVGQLLRYGPATPWQRRTIRDLSLQLDSTFGGGYIPWWSTYASGKYEVTRLRGLIAGTWR